MYLVVPNVTKSAFADWPVGVSQLLCNLGKWHGAAHCITNQYSDDSLCQPLRSTQRAWPWYKKIFKEKVLTVSRRNWLLYSFNMVYNENVIYAVSPQLVWVCKFCKTWIEYSNVKVVMFRMHFFSLWISFYIHISHSWESNPNPGNNIKVYIPGHSPENFI